MAEVVVVGAGVGGLAASIHLAAAGHDVLVLERLERAGGKLDERSAAGFTWETGPSLLTLPHVFEDLARTAGRSLDELVTLRRLDPICRYRFADGTTFDHRADLDDAIDAAEALAPGAGAEWRAFMDHARQVWEVASRTFFVGPMSSPLGLARRMRSPRDLLAIDPLRTLHQRASASFTDPRLVQYVDRYATYSGSSPFHAPATLACIAHVEQALGAWYVHGGLGRLADALVELAGGLGVEVRTGVDVAAVTHAGGRARGVRLAGGEHLEADAVVANVDALHLYRDLLPHRAARRRAEAAPRSSSGFVLLLGVDGTTDGLAHHNVSFSADYAAEFDALVEQGVPATDPTVYVCASSVTDPAQAPAGSESWFVLVNAPEGGGDMPGYGDHLLDVMARRGWDLSGRIAHREEITPADIAERFRTPGGAIYGTSSDGRMAAFLRPGNRGPLDRLYLCGGSSHPGGGLPLVAMSGRIAAELCTADLRQQARR
ncbi:MAG TPA: phytoene desaturase family protein [Acidimicrobiales bacterium]|nr:phytoene desaturase family protein [Acidimicrobiales bacterium]